MESKTEKWDNYLNDMTTILTTALKPNPNIKTIIIIRHGQSEGNKKKVLSGSVNYDLNENGKAQSTKMNQFLKPFLPHFDKIISSPKLRAIKTCEFALQTPMVTSYPGKAVDGTEIPMDPVLMNLPQTETASLIKSKFSIDTRIREISFGDFHGKKKAEVSLSIYEAFFIGKVFILLSVIIIKGRLHWGRFRKFSSSKTR
jgi:hypothetical protein